MTAPIVRRPATERAWSWARHNLFRGRADTACTLVFGVLGLWLLYKALGFVFVTGRWTIIEQNLKLLMVGRFPAAHVPRLAVSLIVLCYAQAASYFDRPGGGYLYAREAFGSLIGFEVGWMLVLTRIAAAAALANGLAEAVTHFWPAADTGWARIAIVAGSLALLVGPLLLASLFETVAIDERFTDRVADQFLTAHRPTG